VLLLLLLTCSSKNGAVELHVRQQILIEGAELLDSLGHGYVLRCISAAQQGVVCASERVELEGQRMERGHGRLVLPEELLLGHGGVPECIGLGAAQSQLGLAQSLRERKGGRSGHGASRLAVVVAVVAKAGRRASCRY
jgi:hypothetical protein